MEHSNEENTSNINQGCHSNKAHARDNHQGRQILPTNIRSTSSRSASPSDKLNQDDGEIPRSKINHGPLSEIPIVQEATGYRSFDHLQTTNEVSKRITQFARRTGTVITANDNRWLSTLWILLKDIRLVSTLIRQARIKFNYLCANLIEIFVNISKIEWVQPTPPGGAIEQLGFDLLRHILAADVE